MKCLICLCSEKRQVPRFSSAKLPYKVILRLGYTVFSPKSLLEVFEKTKKKKKMVHHRPQRYFVFSELKTIFFQIWKLDGPKLVLLFNSSLLRNGLQLLKVLFILVSQHLSDTMRRGSIVEGRAIKFRRERERDSRGYPSVRCCFQFTEWVPMFLLITVLPTLWVLRIKGQVTTSNFSGVYGENI